MPRMTQKIVEPPTMSPAMLAQTVSDTKQFKANFAKVRSSSIESIQLLITHIHRLVKLTHSIRPQNSLESIFPSQQTTRLNIELLQAVGTGQGDLQTVIANLKRVLAETEYYCEQANLKQKPIKQYLMTLTKGLQQARKQQSRSALNPEQKQRLLAFNIEI